MSLFRRALLIPLRLHLEARIQHSGCRRCPCLRFPRSGRCNYRPVTSGPSAQHRHWFWRSLDLPPPDDALVGRGHGSIEVAMTERGTRADQVECGPFACGTRGKGGGRFALPSTSTHHVDGTSAVGGKLAWPLPALVMRRIGKRQSRAGRSACKSDRCGLRETLSSEFAGLI